MSDPSRRRPARVRVTRTVPLQARVGSPVRSEDVVSVFDRSLRKAQLRTSLATLALVCLPLLSLPLLAVLLPALAATPVLGLPLGWLVLAVLVYPLLWLAGRRHVREAERTEADFRELLGPDHTDRDPTDRDPTDRDPTDRDPT